MITTSVDSFSHSGMPGCDMPALAFDGSWTAVQFMLHRMAGKPYSSQQSP